MTVKLTFDDCESDVVRCFDVVVISHDCLYDVFRSLCLGCSRGRLVSHPGHYCVFVDRVCHVNESAISSAAGSPLMRLTSLIQIVAIQ